MTGDIVHYHYVIAGERADEPVKLAAIVTVTHEDWSPGYHGADGTWVPQAPTVPQPAKDHVHLTWFSPTPNVPPRQEMNVPHQRVASPGQSYWMERS